MQLTFLFVLTCVISAVAQLDTLWWLLGCDSSPDVGGGGHFKDYGLTQTRGAIPRKTLVGAGMRRKSLLVAEVDVYAVGLYLTVRKDKEARKARGWTPKLLSSGTTVTLLFARALSGDKITKAIVDALRSKDKKNKGYRRDLDKLKVMILEGMGSDGASKGDLIEFTLGSSVEVSVRGRGVGSVKNAELCEQLVALYVDPKKSLVPELVQCLKDRYVDAGL